jgi:acetate kinase
MTALVLCLNAGSSSIKFAVFAAAATTAEQPREICRGMAAGLGATPALQARMADGRMLANGPIDVGGRAFHEASLAAIVDILAQATEGAPVVGVGHRIVHGGSRHVASTFIDDHLVAELEDLGPLAPLHQPHNLAGVAAARRLFPAAVQVACFDTAFHRTQEKLNDCYALPRRFYEEGIRRYGFHGLSYSYVIRELARLDETAARGRVVIAHLGNGASMCGLRGGRAVMTTMGFSPLDGLAMGTRTGRIDPSVVFYLARQGLALDAVEDILYRQSGLKGLSGLTSDMRTLEAAGTPEAEEAIAYFVQAIRRELGGLAADLGGLDTLVFTGGIGENSWRVRERATEALDWLGIRVDRRLNRQGAAVISVPRSRVTVRVVPTNEEAYMAGEVVRLMPIDTPRIAS